MNRTNRTKPGIPAPEEYLRDLGLDDLPELARPSDVARRLGVGRQAIYELVSTGELAGIRIGTSGLRVFRRSVTEYVRRRLV